MTADSFDVAVITASIEAIGNRDAIVDFTSEGRRSVALIVSQVLGEGVVGVDLRIYLKLKAGSVRIKDETGIHGIPTLDVTVRLTERNCENLQRQVESFLRALKKRRSAA